MVLIILVVPPFNFSHFILELTFRGKRMETSARTLIRRTVLVADMDISTFSARFFETLCAVSSALEVEVSDSWQTRNVKVGLVMPFDICPNQTGSRWLVCPSDLRLKPDRFDDIQAQLRQPKCSNLGLQLQKLLSSVHFSS
jgi:hypothetical protein